MAEQLLDLTVIGDVAVEGDIEGGALGLLSQFLLEWPRAYDVGCHVAQGRKGRDQCADALPLDEMPEENDAAPAEAVLWYYRALVEAFKARGTSPLIAELERVVDEMVRVADGVRSAAR